jgi:hypothetical protein
MKKRNLITWVAVVIAALLLGAAGCDDAKNAQLVVRNDLGFDIAELSLTGDADTGDLLGGTIIPKDAEGVSVAGRIEPGMYTWHVLYSNAPKQSDQGSAEFELFPGKNHLVLSLTPMF